MSESDVCRCQILMYKNSPCNERIKMFIMAVDPYQRYSNEAERLSQIKKKVFLHGLYKNTITAF